MSIRRSAGCGFVDDKPTIHHDNMCLIVEKNIRVILETIHPDEKIVDGSIVLEREVPVEEGMNHVYKKRRTVAGYITMVASCQIETEPDYHNKPQSKNARVAFMVKPSRGLPTGAIVREINYYKTIINYEAWSNSDKCTWVLVTKEDRHTDVLVKEGIRVVEIEWNNERQEDEFKSCV